MAYDMFLKIDGVKGDSTDAAHKDWIEVVSFEHAVSQPSGGALSAQGAIPGGRADHADFSIVKRVDSATPILSQHCCTAKHIPNVTFELCRAMGEKTTFMVYRLRDVIVSSVAPEGSADAEDPLPFEEIKFRYSEIQWSYTPTDPTGGGKVEATIQAGWSTRQNKPM